MEDRDRAPGPLLHRGSAPPVGASPAVRGSDAVSGAPGVFHPLERAGHAGNSAKTHRTIARATEATSLGPCSALSGAPTVLLSCSVPASSRVAPQSRVPQVKTQAERSRITYSDSSSTFGSIVCACRRRRSPPGTTRRGRWRSSGSGPAAGTGQLDALKGEVCLA
jgi:hypothetical protein